MSWAFVVFQTMLMDGIDNTAKPENDALLCNPFTSQGPQATARNPGHVVRITRGIASIS